MTVGAKDNSAAMPPVSSALQTIPRDIEASCAHVIPATLDAARAAGLERGDVSLDSGEIPRHLPALLPAGHEWPDYCEIELGLL